MIFSLQKIKKLKNNSTCVLPANRMTSKRELNLIYNIHTKKARVLG